MTKSNIVLTNNCQWLGMRLWEEVGRYGFKRAIEEIFVVIEYHGCDGGYTDLLMTKCIELNVYVHAYIHNVSARKTEDSE